MQRNYNVNKIICKQTNTKRSTKETMQRNYNVHTMICKHGNTKKIYKEITL